MNADHTPRPTGGWPEDENRPVFAPTDATTAVNSQMKEQS